MAKHLYEQFPPRTAEAEFEAKRPDISRTGVQPADSGVVTITPLSLSNRAFIDEGGIYHLAFQVQGRQEPLVLATTPYALMRLMGGVADLLNQTASCNVALQIDDPVLEQSIIVKARPKH